MTHRRVWSEVGVVGRTPPRTRRMKNQEEELALDQPLKAPLGWWKKKKEEQGKGEISLETMMDKYGTQWT
jgi:hypothetical protein